MSPEILMILDWLPSLEKRCVQRRRLSLAAQHAGPGQVPVVRPIVHALAVVLTDKISNCPHHEKTYTSIHAPPYLGTSSRKTFHLRLFTVVALD